MWHIIRMTAKMESMTIRELRNTRRLEALLRAGKTVRILKRNHVIGRVMPDEDPQDPKKIEWPDFEARRKKIFGNRILPGADLLIEERGRY
jgi:hypothetical protein